MNTFGEQLRKLRKQKDLTQQELGDKIGTRRQIIANWEVGNSEPSLGDLVTLSHFFGVTIDFLIKGNDEKDETARLKAENEKLKAKVLEFVLGKYRGVFIPSALRNLTQSKNFTMAIS